MKNAKLNRPFNPSLEVRPEVKYKIDNLLDLTEEEQVTFTYGEFLYLGVEDEIYNVAS